MVTCTKVGAIRDAGLAGAGAAPGTLALAFSLLSLAFLFQLTFVRSSGWSPDSRVSLLSSWVAMGLRFAGAWSLQTSGEGQRMSLSSPWGEPRGPPLLSPLEEGFGYGFC